MVHTWQSNHLPKLEISNLESGDIAVCGSFAKHESVLTQLDKDRVGFAAPLLSRADLEWLLRGLHLHPNIRHLVVCGGDAKATGESLLALWEEGVDANGRLTGSRGILSAELDSASVDALRDDVRIWDLRGKSPAEVANAVSELPTLSRERASRTLPDPVIPERKIFLSRKTTFPIYSGDVGDSWLQLLNLALKIGTEKQSDDGERMAEALNAIVTIELSAEEPEFPSFLDFDRGDFDRFHRQFGTPRFSEEARRDPLDVVCDRLTKSLDTHSGTLVFLEPSDMADPEVASSLISATFNVVDRKLFGSFVLRSADLYTDWPLEAMALVRMQREVAERVGVEIGSATFVIHSAHLYERDWDRSMRVLQESFKRPLPLQVDPSGIFLFGNDGGQARAMLLDHDANTIFWEDAFNDPEDLSWYIVDVMPWLLPQHVRYVGQECASLMRAIRESECYLQG